MIKKSTFFILLITLFSLFCTTGKMYAQDLGNVRGVVVDSTNGEVLPFSSAYIPELKVGMTTDSRGIFLFTGIKAGKRYSIILSYVGYKTKRQYFMINPNKMTSLKIALAPSEVNIATVEVEGERVKRENATDISLQKIFARELENMPKSVETDALRSLQYMPGVQFSGDASARFYVRGGTNNQNMILLDDAIIYNPYHALGVFSAIDPEMISSMEFHKGAFPTEFGGRLSSVLKIVTKDGNRNRFAGRASLSFLTAKALFEGPIPGGSFMVTGRKSTSTEVLKKFFNDKSYPVDFYDFSFKVNYSDPRVMKDAKFTAHGFFSGDELLNNNPAKPDFKWSNHIFGLNYFQLSDTPLFYDVSFNYSKFTGEIIPNSTPTKASSNMVEDFSAKLDVKYVYPSKNELDFGFKIQDIKTKLILTNSTGYASDLGAKGIDISVYGKYMLMELGSFGADFGVRMNLTRMRGGNTSGIIEPRARATYRIIPELAIKAAWGIYLQEMTTISDENEIISLYEPWIITPLYLNPAKSTHYVAGIESEFFKDVFLNIDAYYKLSTDVAIVNDNKIFVEDKDLIPGKTESYGMEMLFKTNQEFFNFTTSYTLSWTLNDINGKRYPPRYDARHNLSLMLDINFGNDWNLSTAWVYTSGHPFTQIRGYYDKLNATGIFSGASIFQDFLPFMLLTDRNTARLPDYHRLDLTLSKKFNLGFMRLTLDVSVINAYNRKNLFYFDRKTGEQVNMLPILPTATIKAEI